MERRFILNTPEIAYRRYHPIFLDLGSYYLLPKNVFRESRKLFVCLLGKNLTCKSILHNVTIE